ncbi:DNA-processing protein DprA [Tepidimonas charontis]|uniref:DNA processing protein DprA n=1 Tax=Tepidimonas charontis TaxID=2267262 RepID=A0A554XAL1_9BURK|nr:DNA-processing protein DprA [Tepidimonas charontis]TSE32874.1 DNA processing protein DprA [Tepidimonas charontis]
MAHGPDDWEDWLRLLATEGVGPATAHQLLRAFGGPAAIFAQRPAALARVVGETVAARLLRTPTDWDAQRTRLRTWLADDTHHLLTLADPDYPRALLDLPDAPPLLYAVGDVRAAAAARRLAIVGSRNPTPQGADNAESFARALAAEGVCVISGLAAGIDAAAHRGALAAGGPTVAVVGTGVDRVYPARHRALAQAIAAHGCVVSELPLGTPPLPAHFPRRNRLIAALAHGTLVVEAALGSGSLITAELAAHLGREVFAIPGSIHSPLARGCHALIRQGAKLVETVAHITEELHALWGAPVPLGTDGHTRTVTATDETPAVPTPTDDPILAALGYDPTPLDVLQARCGWDTARLQAHLLTLELDGHLQRLPGGWWQRLGRA